MEITFPGTLGRVVPPAGVSPINLSHTLSVGQSLVGEIVRVDPHSGVLVNFHGQYVWLELGQQLAPGQAITATVTQVVPTLVLQLLDNPALQTSPELPLASLATDSEGQQGIVTASELKAYLAASQPFGEIVTGLAALLRGSPVLHDLAPGLTQELADTLAVLQSQGAIPPDAIQLKEQVDRSGLNYESKVQRALTGEAALTTAALAKDLKGLLLELSHRLQPLLHTGAETQQRAVTTVLERLTRAVQALEFQQLSNQLALQEHQPLVLPLVNPFVSPPQTTQLIVHRDEGQAEHPAAEQERYTVALALDLSALGALHLEATVHGAAVSVMLHVEDPAVAVFLRAAVPELSARLQELGLQACVACEVQEHVAHAGEGALPRALTRAVKLVDVKI